MLVGGGRAREVRGRRVSKGILRCMVLVYLSKSDAF
jgi:hypothetical protein